MKFFEELKKRNVYKAGVAYVVTGWLLLQIVDVVGPGFGWPESLTALVTKILLVGFPIALVLAWLYELTPKGFKRTGTYQEDTADNKKVGRRLNNFIIGILALAVCFLLADKVFFTGTINSQNQNKELANSRDYASSIAVLAFADMSPDKDQEYLSDGISEEILNHLAKYRDLKVISRTSSFAYKHRDVTADVIGEELGVANVLEGSVRKAGDNYRITVQLIDTKDGAHIWSDTFDRKIENVLFVQDEIARIVAERLNTNLLNKESYLRKVDPEAYEWYLKGKTNLSFLTPQIVDVAEQNFIRSIEIDPEFAPAYAGLAGVWIVRKQLNHPGYTPAETNAKYTQYIERSFALDSTDAEIWRMYAAKLAYEYNWQGCEEAIERCLEIKPNFAEAHAFYAHFAMMQSKWDKAWMEINKAQQLDPINPLVQFFYDAMLVHSGQFDKARELSWSDLNFIYYGFQNMQDSVIIALRNNVVLRDKPGIIDILEDTYANEGYEQALNVLADTLGIISEQQHVNAALITLLYQLAENQDKTAQWIERMYTLRDPNLPYFAIRHPSKPQWLYENPRIQEVMKEINLWE
ncbi:MAG: hypothetical protein P8Z38_12275 [Robiginitalea sp.]